MKFRAYIAMSVDGYVATEDGGVAWLEAFQAADYGYEAFIGEIAVIVTGRATFDQARGFGEWPYAGKRVVVLTSHPIDDPPPDTEAWHDGAEALAARLRAEAPDGDAWVLGGPKTIDAFRRAGAVDTYELYVMPVLLGAGIPMFGRNDAPSLLGLANSHAYPDGAVRLIYEPLRAALTT